MNWDGLPRRKGFTIVELLVVIVIIIVLAGLLLPALNSARKRGMRAAAQSQLTNLSNACQSYFSTFGSYPGYFPETKMVWPEAKAFTGTENLVLSLMGRVVPSSGNADKPIGVYGKTIDLAQVGDGPSTESGQTYGAFYSPNASELGAVSQSQFTPETAMPEFLGAGSGAPILYYRAQTPSDSNPWPVRPADDRGYFVRHNNLDYTNLGPNLKGPHGKRFDQSSSLISNDTVGSGNADANLASTVISATLSPTPNDPNVRNNVVKGGFVLIAPGPDGIYLSKRQNIDPKNPDPDNDGVEEGGDFIGHPKKLKRFDDVINVGGSAP